MVQRQGEDASADDLLEHTRSQIARYKVPDVVEFVAELPKTSTGKIQRFQLRERDWAGHRSRVQG